MNDLSERDEEYEAEIEERMKSIRTPLPGSFNARELAFDTLEEPSPPSWRKPAVILGGVAVLVTVALLGWYLLV